MLMTELLMTIRADRDRELEADLERRRHVLAAKASRPSQAPETPRPTASDTRAAVARRPSSGPSAL
jgi:hypothetical protein